MIPSYWLLTFSYWLLALQMAIHRLPDYIINRLKAWEIVQRPASVIKELVENSLDAGAENIEICINDWWKSLISVQDDWSGIELSDMDLLLERYATSKINNEEDLFNIKNYWFRWEALASIAEVSKTTVISKTTYSEIWTKLTRRGAENIIKNVPVGFEHWTFISIEDIFYNVPARQKFLKSAQTEFYYCYNYFVDIALRHYNKRFVLKKNDKIVFDLTPQEWLLARITDIYKKDRSANLLDINYTDDRLTLWWVVSDSSLRFGSAENIKIYVNSRPIEDKVIKKALMDAYYRQIMPGEYPLAILILDVKTDMVDVNVHPSKLQVKFRDSRKIYEVIYESVKTALSWNKIASVSMEFKRPDIAKWSEFNLVVWTDKQNNADKFIQEGLISPNEISNFSVHGSGFVDFEEEKIFENEFIWEYKLVWQMRNSYIVLEDKDSVYYIDQHALAERIAFEKMKKEKSLNPEILLQPLKFDVINIPDSQDKISQLNQLWFDISLIGENVIAVYAVPKVFVIYPVDLSKLLNYVFYLEKITYDNVLDWIFATKACKTSIKAGHRLSMQQMANLVKEWFDNIEGMFVCQHGRTFFVQVEKNNIDKMFDR